jgi:hypothetical protein
VQQPTAHLHLTTQADAAASSAASAAAARGVPERTQLAALWGVFVDGACLGSSHERKALALQLLQLLLPVMEADAVPLLLSRPLCSCIATSLRNHDSYLHASAKRAMVRVLPVSTAALLCSSMCVWSARTVPAHCPQECTTHDCSAVEQLHAAAGGLMSN